jgi:hypothetical protein
VLHCTVTSAGGDGLRIRRQDGIWQSNTSTKAAGNGFVSTTGNLLAQHRQGQRRLPTLRQPARPEHHRGRQRLRHGRPVALRGAHRFVRRGDRPGCIPMESLLDIIGRYGGPVIFGLVFLDQLGFRSRRHRC